MNLGSIKLTRNEIILMVALFVLVVYVGLTAKNWHQDGQDVESVQADVDVLEGRVAALKRTINLNSAKKELNDAKSVLAEAEAQFLGSADAGSFDLLNHISQSAVQAGVNLKQADPRQQGSHSSAKGYYETREVLVAATGTEQQVRSFLTRLQGASTIPVALTNIKLEPQSSGAWNVSMSVVIVVKKSAQAP